MSVKTIEDLLSLGNPVDWDEFLARHATQPSEVASCTQGDALLDLLSMSPPPAVLSAIYVSHRLSSQRRKYLPKKKNTSSSSCCDKADDNKDPTDRLGQFAESYAKTAYKLFEASPKGVGNFDRNGMLPLHHAIRCRHTSEVIQLLIYEGEELNVGGRKGAGGVLVKDRDGETPLSLVCKNILCATKMDGYSGPLPLDEDSMPDWDVLTVVLRAAAITNNYSTMDQAHFSFPSLLSESLSSFTWSLGDEESYEPESLSHAEKSKKNHRGFKILHAVLELRCPPIVAWHAMKLNPMQIKERDGQGRTPLSIAVMNDETSPAVIEWLVDPTIGNPAMAKMATADGKLPLHISVTSGREFEDGVEALMKAEPRALRTRGIDSHMFPFMLAAVNDNCTLNTVYKLLREDPSIFYVLTGNILNREKPLKRRSFLVMEMFLSALSDEKL